MKETTIGSLTTVVVAASIYICFVRARQLRWGATEQEFEEPLPGDDLVEKPDLTATRAISISAPAEVVWPWIAQLGQSRGGFYSYDALENLVGCNIHSSDRIVPEWQDIAVGDRIHLAAEVALSVAELQPGRSLVLHGAVPVGRIPPPYDFTWAFVLRSDQKGTSRLLVRERYAYTRRWVRFLVEPVAAVSFVMSQKMLRGIKRRAEGTAFDRKAKRAA